jgi:hypothetical protein
MAILTIMRWAGLRALAFVGFASLVSLGTSCGGGTALGGIPRPNVPFMAGLAAAAATAATIADPGAAGRLKEAGEVQHLDRQDGSSETLPLEILDRMDEDDAQSDDDPASP